MVISQVLETSFSALFLMFGFYASLINGFSKTKQGSGSRPIAKATERGFEFPVLHLCRFSDSN